MRMLIKTLIMFVLLFMMFFPLSIVMDRTFSEIDSAASDYGNTTSHPTEFTQSVTNQTSFFGQVFRILYSIAGVSAILNLLVLAFVKRTEGDMYQY